MTQPITINEGFSCEKCHKMNTKAEKSCRNHCQYCLFSKHVDEMVPGDRKSNCHGLMEPIGVFYNTQKGNQLVHKCLHCGKEMVNKLSDDDNQELVIQIIQKQNLNALPSPFKKHG